jgi:hypothetical protein
MVAKLLCVVGSGPRGAYRKYWHDRLGELPIVTTRGQSGSADVVHLNMLRYHVCATRLGCSPYDVRAATAAQESYDDIESVFAMRTKIAAAQAPPSKPRARRAKKPAPPSLFGDDDGLALSPVPVKRRKRKLTPRITHRMIG